MSHFYVSVQLRVYSSHALSHLFALFHVGVWCSVPGTQVLSFGFVTGFEHLHLVILETLLSKATYNWGIHKAIDLEEANRQRKCP